MIQLSDVYKPIKGELKHVDAVLEASLGGSKNGSIIDMGRFLLGSPGKRIRTAMVILTANLSGENISEDCRKKTVEVAAAVELIHMASLIHDDVIDHSDTRHNRPTISSKWGPEVAITLGDYLYSKAFELISVCGNMDILQCVSSAAKEMCEGELMQVCERDNLELLKERYLTIVKKKTASLFAASCQTGAVVVNGENALREAMTEYGMNFGIAFQIADDYLDVVSDEKQLGKVPGQDIGVGEVTLPVLNLLEAVPEKERAELQRVLFSGEDNKILESIKTRLVDSGAALKTKQDAGEYISMAKQRVDTFPGSDYKESLLSLADFVMDKGFRSIV